MMRIIVTGAGGFIGQHVISELGARQVIAIDKNLSHIPDRPFLTKIEGDLQDHAVIDHAFSKGCDAVIHLATVPGGAAEDHPKLAKAVNIDATMALLEKATGRQTAPRFVFASTIAVFGKLSRSPVVDHAQTQPTLLYGAHKLMMENWIRCLSQRGSIEGISLRLSGVIARPQSVSGLKSAFLSDLFHALSAKRDFIMPVSEEATSWLCSVKSAARNIAFAATKAPYEDRDVAPILLPALCVKMIDLEREIRRQLPASTSVIRYSVDKDIQSNFANHPKLRTPLAKALGYVGDESLGDLVTAALARL